LAARSVRMRPSSAAHPARTGLAGADRRFIPASTGGKNRKLLAELCRTAARAFRPFPIIGPDQNLVFLSAFPALKFVNRHAAKYRDGPQSSSRQEFRHKKAQRGTKK
jgi:hypothetical protein